MSPFKCPIHNCDLDTAGNCQSCLNANHNTAKITSSCYFMSTKEELRRRIVELEANENRHKLCIHKLQRVVDDYTYSNSGSSPKMKLRVEAIRELHTPKDKTVEEV